MCMIGKYLLKNIMSKPLRTLLLVVCILCFSFVSVLSLDMTGELEPMVYGMMSQITGTSDILAATKTGTEQTYALSEEADQLLLFEAQNSYIRVEPEFYTYFHRDAFQIMYCDYELAYRMQLIDRPIQLGAEEAAVTPLFAEQFGYTVGEQVELYDEAGVAHRYEIAAVTAGKGISNGRAAVFVNQEQFHILSSVKKANLLYVDVLEDSRIGQVKAELEQADYNLELQVFREDEALKEMVATVAAMFAMIFAICFLLVIFVTISVNGRIIHERMSVVGTFRSLGFSPAFVTKLLMGENILYGLLGSGLGVWLYSLCREALFGSVYSVSATSDITVNMEIDRLNPLFILLTVVFVILVECGCPLKEVIKTSKMSIRDIIFDNKDTAYQMSRGTVVFGVVSLLGAVLLMLADRGVWTNIASFVLMICAVAMLFPCVLKLITTGLLKLLEEKSPLAKLAVRECIARKSTVGSAVLCVTASSLALIIFMFADTIDAIYKIDTYHADVIATVGYQEEPAQFSYIKDLEGVTSVESIYTTFESIELNGTAMDMNVFGLPEQGFALLTGIHGLPKQMENHQVYMDKGVCDKLGLVVGQEVELVFGAETFLPARKTLTLAGYIDSYQYDTTSKGIVISQKMYVDIYHDYPTKLLIACEDAQAVKNQMEKYSATKLEGIQTLQEYQEEWQQKGQDLKGLLTFIIVLGIGLTVIGIISNQIVGFQGRRRECAVLLSTSMTRGKLCYMLMLETAVSSAVALLTALPAAALAVYPLKKALVALAGELPMVVNGKNYVLFLVALWVVFTAVSLFPMKELRKMQIAAQLKYE